MMMYHGSEDAQYYGKTYDALSRVTTPFAAVAQDDDFYFIEGLQGIVKRESKFYLLRQINPKNSSNRAEHEKKGIT